MCWISAVAGLVRGATCADGCTTATGFSAVNGLDGALRTGVRVVAILAWAGAFAWASWAAWIASAVGWAGLTLAVTTSGFVIESPRLNAGCWIVCPTTLGRA